MSNETLLPLGTHVKVKYFAAPYPCHDGIVVNHDQYMKLNVVKVSTGHLGYYPNTTLEVLPA